MDEETLAETIAEKIRAAEKKAEQIAILSVTMKKDKEEIRKIAIEHGVIRAWSDEKCRELYCAGHTDHQLSEDFGFDQKVIAQWRAKHQLKPNRFEMTVKKRKSHIDDTKAMELYELGQTDAEIGKAFGVSSNTVLVWRRKNHLPSKYVPKGKADKQDSPAPAPGIAEPDMPVPDPEPAGIVRTCECCGIDLPTRGEVTLLSIAVIGGEEYRICSKCAGIISWVSVKQRMVVHK